MAHVPTEVRRQQIIDAAVVVVARSGVDGAKTRRIAEEAKAPLATLHYCFQTKENLLWAVFEHITAQTRADIEQAETGAATVDSIAAELLTKGVVWAIEHPEHNRAQLEIWLWAMRNNPELGARLYTSFMDVWKDFLRGASEPLSEERLETVTRLLVALLDGLCMQFLTHHDGPTLMRELETAKQMLAAYFAVTSPGD